MPLTFQWRSERFWDRPVDAGADAGTHADSTTALPGGQSRSVTHAALWAPARACQPGMWLRHRFRLASSQAELHRYAAACALQSTRQVAATGEGCGHPGRPTAQQGNTRRK